MDPSRAPAGRHTAWADCHVPSHSAVDMTQAIERQVERFAPGFGDLILARSTRGPARMERENPNHVGGDINGGVADLRQTIARPWPGGGSWVAIAPGRVAVGASRCGPPDPGVGVERPRVSAPGVVG